MIRYADREWVAAGAAADAPAVVAADADAAAAMLAALARDAVAAASGDRVAVTGDGLVAAEARRLLADEGRLADESPNAVVETTGDPAAIVSATERVADMGTVVLAGEPAGRALRLDLYPDIHLRGLRMLGVPRPETTTGAVPPDAQAGLRDAGDPDPAARWYRL